MLISLSWFNHIRDIKKVKVVKFLFICVFVFLPDGENALKMLTFPLYIGEMPKFYNVSARFGALPPLKATNQNYFIARNHPLLKFIDLLNMQSYLLSHRPFFFLSVVLICSSLCKVIASRLYCYWYVRRSMWINLLWIKVSLLWYTNFSDHENVTNKSS